MNSYKVEGWFSLGFKNSLFYKKEVRVEANKERRVREKLLRKFENEIDQLQMKVSNFGLLANKFIPIINAKIITPQDKRKEWFSFLKVGKECIGGESKFSFLKRISNFPFDKNQCKKINERVEFQISSLKKEGYKEVLNRTFTTKSRLVVGLGTDSVLETSIALHQIFGIPYIPATALKGVVRAVKFWELAKDRNIPGNEAALKILQAEFYGDLYSQDKEILKAQLLFGAKNFKGLLLFLDTFPEIEGNMFEVDIMNVHYPNYYAGNEPPTDWQQPRPIFFLTIKQGVKFYISVLFDNYRYEKLPTEYKKLEWNDLKTEIENLISLGLSDFGIGAKTRLGYGLLE